MLRINSSNKLTAVLSKALAFLNALLYLSFEGSLVRLISLYYKVWVYTNQLVDAFKTSSPPIKIKYFKVAYQCQVGFVMGKVNID